MTIKHHDLANVDQNLLVALDTLLTERSVTRAVGHLKGMSGKLQGPSR